MYYQEFLRSRHAFEYITESSLKMLPSVKDNVYNIFYRTYCLGGKGGGVINHSTFTLTIAAYQRQDR